MSVSICLMKSFLLALSLFTTAALAEDWGMYQITSVSAPEFVLEAVGGTKEGDSSPSTNPPTRQIKSGSFSRAVMAGSG